MSISIAENRDCMDAMREFENGYFDLAVVDPPYGIRDSGGVTGGAGTLKNRLFQNGIIDRWDHAPSPEYFKELFRVSKNQIIFGGNYFDLPPSRCVLVWDKCQPWENFSQVEIAWTSFGLPAQIFRFDNRTGDKIHPTQKPVALYQWIFQKYAKPGYKILDIHLGSGSSRIAAYDAELDFWGYEIDKDFFRQEEQRFEDHTAQLRIDFQVMEE